MSSGKVQCCTCVKLGVFPLTEILSEMIRRTFQRWLSASRHAQHRRQRLERKEHQIRLEVLGRVWDVWRDKFKEEGLQVAVSLSHIAMPAWVFNSFFFL
jgi:hypothetical protein